MGDIMTLYIATSEGQRPMTAEEEAEFLVIKEQFDKKRSFEIASNVRNERNQKLVQSDWTQMPDVPLTIEQKQAWAEYRQFLRDITNQDGFPETIDWGTQPQL